MFVSRGHKHAKVGQLMILAQEVKQVEIDFAYFNFKPFINVINFKMYLPY